MRCSQGERGWEPLSVDIAWCRSDLEGCGCPGEAPFKFPGGLCVSSCVGAVLFCGVSLSDLGVTASSG